MSSNRSVDDVVETLRNAKRWGTKCSLLVGAGCSVDAGIPAAAGIIREIERHYARSYARANPKTYPNCMAQLARGERKRLIAHYVDQAKVNWAHVGIAALIHHDYVDRVLTTNFDPLVMRACAMMGEYPAVYDFAASQKFQPADVADKSIFHLHGQRSGFVLLHTEDEVIQHKESLRPVFEDAGQGRLWIVVGYSGENDPVFDLLAEQPHFDHQLFWVGFRDNPAPPHVRKRLLTGDKYAFFVPGHTADSFFVELTRGLNIFPPDLIARPFTHVGRVIETLTPFVVSPSYSGPDVLETARRRIQEAIATLESEATTESGAVTRATELLMEGKHADVIDLHKSFDRPAPELDHVVAWAHIRNAIDLAERTEHAASAEREDALLKAIKETEPAILVSPPLPEGLANWGLFLTELAKLRIGHNAHRLLTDAIEKFRAALEIQPDLDGALNGWGIALGELARLTTDFEAEQLLTEAVEKHRAAVEINPDRHGALNNLAVAIGDLARLKYGSEAEILLTEAAETYRAAWESEPGRPEILNNWGATLLAISRLTSALPTDEVLAEAEGHLSAAEALSPGIAAYNLACVYARKGDHQRCREWLEVSRKVGNLPAVEHILADADLEDVRNVDWFGDLIRQLRSEAS